MMSAASRKGVCFVAAPIGEPASPTRKRSDSVLKDVVRPGAGECGYEALRADEIDEPGVITNQIIERVISSPMLIADLTDANPNVYYELAIRHLVRKPAIHMIHSTQRPAFDLGGNRTILFDHNDPASVQAARGQLVRQIKALEENPSLVDNPISITVEVEAFRTAVDTTRELSAVSGPFSYAWHASEKLRDRLRELIEANNAVSVSELQKLFDSLTQDIVTPLGMMRRHYGLSQWDPDS